MIEPGRSAPGFTMPNQDGEPVTLSPLRGRHVALYFYPKADTPGCTKQACGLRDRAAGYEAAGAVVLGVSPDPVADLRAFADRYGLPSTLLSDSGGEVASRYGVWVERSRGWRTFWGNERTTFLIDPEGVVARVFPRVSPDEHDDLLLGALAELTTGA
jgi:thioredoxin-dependent peroxiredoxin